MGAPLNFKISKVLALILAVRLASVFIVQTSYVPDEYWQSLEVSHNLAFGYGQLTWEWAKGIRSYALPAVFALFYKILEFFNADSPSALILIPRLLQALLSSWADFAFYRWTGNHKWGAFMILIQWFWFYTASRTLVNSVEASLIMLALAKYPFEREKTRNDGWLCLAALSCVIRPTAAVVWLPFCINRLLVADKKLKLVCLTYLPIALSFLGLSTLIDSYFYGKLIFTPWEFVYQNILNDIGSFYGSQPWYWYFVIGFPAVLGINIIPFLYGSYEAAKDKYVFGKQRFLIGVILFVLAVYSILPHKEFRFILPLVQIATFISQDTLSRWSRKAKALYVYIAFIGILLGNLVPAGYFSLIHQRGLLDVTDSLRDIAFRHPANTSFLFLMPCHSTPLYSHLHINIPVRFLTCEPNFKHDPSYKDEAEKFYENPIIWFRREYLNQQIGETAKKSKLPSHIITFDSLVPNIKTILDFYDLKDTIFNMHLADGRLGNFIHIYERSTKTQTPKGSPEKVLQ